MELSALGIIGVLLIWLIASWLDGREEEKVRRMFRDALRKDEDH